MAVLRLTRGFRICVSACAAKSRVPGFNSPSDEARGYSTSRSFCTTKSSSTSFLRLGSAASPYIVTRWLVLPSQRVDARRQEPVLPHGHRKIILLGRLVVALLRGSCSGLDHSLAF